MSAEHEAIEDEELEHPDEAERGQMDEVLVRRTMEPSPGVLAVPVRVKKLG